MKSLLGKRRIFAVVLTLAMLISMSACGCSSTQNKTADTDAAATAESADKAADNVEKTTVDAADPSTVTKTGGTNEGKTMPTEQGDKGGSGWTAAGWANHTGETCEACISLINDTKWDIACIYISPTKSDSWGKDILGDYQFLYSGGLLNKQLNYSKNSLTFDIKVVFADGDECVYCNNYFGNLDSWDMNIEFSQTKNNNVQMSYY